MTLAEEAAALSAEIAELRHAIHREPEIGYDLPRTQEQVLGALDPLPLEITLGRKLSSVTAVLRGGRPGPVVLLRGDMDALPVLEATGLPFASRIDGAMHACGHDLHTGRAATPAQPLTGAEDFSYVLDQVPGAFIMLGASPPGASLDTAPSNHSAAAYFDDAVLADGTALYAELALRRLGA
jgi:metal-dependent amidase/aminoacylase/carboxypeptidase family protein